MQATLSGSWWRRMWGSALPLLITSSGFAAMCLAAIILAGRPSLEGAAQAQEYFPRTTIDKAPAAIVLTHNYWSVPLHVRASLPGATEPTRVLTLTPNYWSIPLHVRASLPGATEPTRALTLTPNYWSIPLHVRGSLADHVR